MTSAYDVERAKAVQELMPVARKLLADGWGHDGAMLILSDAMFEVEATQAKEGE